MKQKAYIIDIDNCWTDSREWMRFVPYGSLVKSDWDEFYNLIGYVRPNTLFIENIIEHFRINCDVFPIFLTSRTKLPQVFAETVRHIENYSHGFFKFLSNRKNCELYMRKDGDWNTATDFKKIKTMKLMETYDFVGAVDDNYENCMMFASLGIPDVYRYDIETNSYSKVD